MRTRESASAHARQMTTDDDCVPVPLLFSSAWPPSGRAPPAPLPPRHREHVDAAPRFEFRHVVPPPLCARVCDTARARVSRDRFGQRAGVWALALQRAKSRQPRSCRMASARTSTHTSTHISARARARARALCLPRCAHDVCRSARSDRPRRRRGSRGVGGACVLLSLLSALPPAGAPAVRRATAHRGARGAFATARERLR